MLRAKDRQGEQARIDPTYHSPERRLIVRLGFLGFLDLDAQEDM